jgi:iron complex outermembrane receptor protein
MTTQQFHRMPAKVALTTGMSLLAFMSAGAAHAQSVANAPEQIIVTAQRRSERLQDVPVSIVAVSPAALERSGVTNMRDLQQLSPSLVTAGTGAELNPAIRGVYASQTDPGNDANISIYVDDIYMPNNSVNSMDLPDVSRVEILEGPQGTLFGRNATGGAIRVFTREPSMDSFTGTLDLGYGNYNDFTAKGFVSVPVVSGKLAVSASGGYERMDGYYHDVVSNKDTPPLDSKTARLKVLVQPSDNLSIELFGSYAYRNDGTASSYQSIDGSTEARGLPGVVIPTQNYTFTTNAPGSTFKTNAYTSAARITLQTDIGQFTSTTSYFSAKSFSSNDADQTNIDTASYPDYQRESSTAEELIFTSKKFGQFQFTGGGDYYGSTGRYDPLVLQGSDFGGVLDGYMRQKTDAYAGFGELTYNPIDRLTIIAGARYSYEKRDAQGGYFAAGPRPASLPDLGHVSYGSFTPRASVRYRLTDEDDNAYFTFSQGFKSGGFNISALQAAPFRPEKLTSYEVGVKTSSSRTFSVNAAVFYYDYTNQQTVANVNGLNITTNAASSRMYGVDGDVNAHVTPDLTLTVGFSVLNAKYRDYPNAPSNVPTGGPGCLCGNTTTYVDLSGAQETRSPKLTLNVTADYQKDTSIGLFDASATVYYNSGFKFYAFPLGTQHRYATLALRASYQPTNSNFTFYAWGRNVTSSLYWKSYNIYNSGNGGVLAPPATYGAGVKYAF